MTRAWGREQRILDGVVARFAAGHFSLAEDVLLRDGPWSAGQDVRLREDIRVRPTPWGRWIAANAYLANDAVCARLHRDGRADAEIAALLADLTRAVRRRCVLCPADPRLVCSGERVRLSARELLTVPQIEPTAAEPERYVTHLPVHGLPAVAASQHPSQWAGRAQEQVIEPLGWLRVTVPGLQLNALMFVARTEGVDVDDRAGGLVEGALAVFELWPAGPWHDRCVLVRDGARITIELASSDPDGQRFSGVERKDTTAEVVAWVVHVLDPGEFARRPRPPRRPGRRDLTSPKARLRISEDLRRDVEHLFAPHEPSEPRELRTPAAAWHVELVCLPAADGGLHLEIGPLRGLWPFVKRIGLVGSESAWLASNVRERGARVRVPADGGPWRWVALGFEDDPDVDLSSLTVDALEPGRAHVFRVDAEGVGRLPSDPRVSPGQRYRILVPPAQVTEEPRDPILAPCGGGWALWELDLPRAVLGQTQVLLRRLGIEVGAATPGVRWVAVPPLEWRHHRGGESHPCFGVNPGPVVELDGLQVEVDGEAAVFVHGPGGTEVRGLPASAAHALHLQQLRPGPHVLLVAHSRTAIPTVRVPFEIVEQEPPAPPASARLLLGEEVLVARPGASVEAEARDLAALDDPASLLELSLDIPPGWPVRVRWREMTEKPVGGPGVLADGQLDPDTCRLIGERARRIPSGSLVFDLGELGRLCVGHARQRQVADVREALRDLLERRYPLAQRGAYATLVPMWFAPVCAELGYRLDPLPPETLPEPPAHLAALRLLHVERQGSRQTWRVARVLILCEELGRDLTAGLLAWIDDACAAAGVREALVSDGRSWAPHRKGSRLPLRGWDLAAAVADDDAFLSFLHIAAEGL